MFNRSYLHIRNNTCLIFKGGNVFIFNGIYGGIPDNVMVNIVAWILLMILFTIVRNRAWDYGRSAVAHSETWTELFYKNADDAAAAVNETDIEETTTEIPLLRDTGCRWFPSLFKITRDKVFARCGPDASHYLLFQQRLLLLKFCITVVAIGVILPVNFQGDLEGNTTSFGHTTISNLEPHSNMLWVHVAASFVFVPLTIIIMRKCSGRNPKLIKLCSRTLMVTGMSKSHRTPESIKNYFSTNYPDVEILDVQVAYKIKKLMNLENRRKLAHEAKMYCLSNERVNLKVQPYGCIICCPWNTKNALEYYTAEEQRLIDLVEEERRNALGSPLSVAFVTVMQGESWQNTLTTFRPGSLKKWSIVKAPSPSDINWEHLQVSSRRWYFKAFVINALLFLVLFFLTTPAIFVEIFNEMASLKNVVGRIPLVSNFLPTLIMLGMSVLMPLIIFYSDEFMSHWTKSKHVRSAVNKTFVFLLLMVLILPSLGLTSTQAFVEWTMQKENMTLRWRCIFLVDKGAFFVNYVITSALIGTALELLRFPELALYVWHLSRIRSEAEKPSMRKEIMTEFPFGLHYTWTLLIFTLSTVYSLTCPLITLFGLLHLGMKHFVDKYNIYFVYRPITMCGEGQQIHADAVKMVQASMILLQLLMIAFSLLRSRFNIMLGVVVTGFIVTCVCFAFLNHSPACKPVLINSVNLPKTGERYIAPVLFGT